MEWEGTKVFRGGSDVAPFVSVDMKYGVGQGFGEVTCSNFVYSTGCVDGQRTDEHKNNVAVTAPVHDTKRKARK